MYSSFSLHPGGIRGTSSSYIFVHVRTELDEELVPHPRIGTKATIFRCGHMSAYKSVSIPSPMDYFSVHKYQMEPFSPLAIMIADHQNDPF